MIKIRSHFLAFLLSILGIALGTTVQVSAAIPAKKLEPTPNRILVGGETKQTLSLLGMSLEENSKKKAERVRLTWGNAVMEPWRGTPGYFHIEYREKEKDAVVELARTMTTFADMKALKAQLKKSKALKDVNVEFDRVSQNLVIHLQFKKSVELTAATGKDMKKGAYLAVDFKEKNLSKSR